LTDGFTTEQHSKTHVIAIGQRQFDRPGFAKQSDVGDDDGSHGSFPARIPDGSQLEDLSFALNRSLCCSLNRVDFETNPGIAVFGEVLQIKHVKRRSSGSGVDFDFDSVDSQFWKFHPLSPSDDWQVFDVPNSIFHVRRFPDGDS